MRTRTEFDPALSASMYLARSQLVSCAPGITLLARSDPLRVYLRFAVDPALILPDIELHFGTGAGLGPYQKLTSGSIVEIVWIYHGPLCGYDWYLKNNGVASIPIFVVELDYHA